MKIYIYSSILFLLLCFSGYAQNTITGTIKDDENYPLPGVSVVIKGMTKGTVSDFDGNYVLEVPQGVTSLVFSMMGMKDVEVSIEEEKVVNVVMKTNVSALDEVVVVGYGTALKKDLTGAIASVKTEDLDIAPVANFDQALAGRVAGVQLSSIEGTPGAGLNITIRGGNSITGDNSPLYVVDGIPLEDFDPASINTNDINSFDILKDASATAIYGSRGANGVIVITTKKGRTDGKSEITIGAEYGVQHIQSRLTVLSPYEYVKYLEHQALAIGNWNYETSAMQQFLNKWVDPELYRNVEGNDWQDRIFQTGEYQRYRLSFSGGNEMTSFYYSGEYLDQKGTLIETGFKKVNNNLRVTHKLSSKTTLNGQLQFSNSDRYGPELRINRGSSIIQDAVRFRPVDPINDDGLGEGGFDPSDPNQNGMFPPVKNLENIERDNNQNIIRGIASLQHKFNSNLTLNLRGNYQLDMRKASTFYGKETVVGSRTNEGISGNVNQAQYNVLSTSNTLVYDKRVKQHKYSVLGGVEFSERSSETSWLQNSNIVDDSFGINNLSLAKTPKLARTSASRNTMLSYFGRINYNYKWRYLFTANFRADGSSKFNKDNRWGYFPSVSGAWKIAEEAFMSDVDFVSNLKLRAGWGITGNNRIGDFAAYSTVSSNQWSGYALGELQEYEPGTVQNNLGVPDLTWETTVQTNIGLDFGFMDNRIDATIDAYHKNTTDLLLNANMAPSIGFDKVQQNIGEVTNTGLELTLNTKNIQNKNFSWSSSFNISFNKNKTVKLNDGQEAIYTNAEYNYTHDEFHYITRVGQPVGMMYGLQSDGVYQNDDFIWSNDNQSFTLKDGVPTNGRDVVAPGASKFIDQNGDGLVNSEDRIILGNPNPKHFGGFVNNFKYKGFDLQILLEWSAGFDVFNANRAVMGNPWSTQQFSGLQEIANAWTPTNTDTNVPAASYGTVLGAAPQGNQMSDRYIEDGSYLRLKTVVLGYSVPKYFCNKMSVASLRFNLSAQNLVTWTNYSGYDPDVSVGRYGALTPNLDYSAYPKSISIVWGAVVKF